MAVSPACMTGFNCLLIGAQGRQCPLLTCRGFSPQKRSTRLTVSPAYLLRFSPLGRSTRLIVSSAGILGCLAFEGSTRLAVSPAHVMLTCCGFSPLKRSTRLTVFPSRVLRFFTSKNERKVDSVPYSHAGVSRLRGGAQD